MRLLRWSFGLLFVFLIGYGSYVLFASHSSLIKNGQKHLVVVVPSYNNKEWYKKNLNSLFAQKYDNYHVIYVDDCSPDGTGDLVRAHIKQCKQEHRCTVITNPERKGTLYNLYHAIHRCNDQDIIIDLDGDDWLYGTDVFATINRAYEDKKVWLTYGQYVMYPENYRGLCKTIPQEIIEKNSYRKSQWMTSHLRTFYAGLFKRIKKQDCMRNGEFYQVTSDMAFMFPLLEMAAGHLKFIDQVIYVYNNDTPINDYKVRFSEQSQCERIIRSQTPYAALSTYEAQQFIQI